MTGVELAVNVDTIHPRDPASLMNNGKFGTFGNLSVIGRKLPW